MLFQANDESLRGCLGGCVFVYSPLVIVNGGGETGTLHNTRHAAHPACNYCPWLPGIIWETLLQCSLQLRSWADNPSNASKAHVLAPLQLLPLVASLCI